MSFHLLLDLCPIITELTLCFLAVGEWPHSKDGSCSGDDGMRWPHSKDGSCSGDEGMRWPHSKSDVVSDDGSSSTSDSDVIHLTTPGQSVAGFCLLSSK